MVGSHALVVGEGRWPFRSSGRQWQRLAAGWIVAALVGGGAVAIGVESPASGTSGAAGEDGSGVGAVELPPLPEEARLVLDEDWSDGIEAERWYVFRRHWGAGNHGVVEDNVWVETEPDGEGGERQVLVCRAHGDEYEGEVRGLWNRPDRVGGVIASREFFASGRYEVEMRIGHAGRFAGGPPDPARPAGMVPAIWTYAGRTVRVPADEADRYHDDQPLYQPYLQEWGPGNGFYWSELDFPEFGKQGDYRRGLYNTFTNKRHESLELEVPVEFGGEFHTYVSEWRTDLVELEGVTDGQVMEHEGWWWIRDLEVPFESYLGNPLQRLGADRYAVHTGTVVRHWIDGQYVGENRRFVPSMAAQLTLGVWLPDWAGPAPWRESRVSFGRIRVWQYDDPGDVRGILTEDAEVNIGPDGEPIR